MHALFYLLEHADEPGSDVPAHFDLGARLACEQYRQGQRVFIFVDNRDDAHLVDQHLWAFDADCFVPHNLQGEGPRAGAAVEIGQTPPVSRRSVLINLASSVPDFIRRFDTVFDFVPADDTRKHQARARYKQLRDLGAQLATQKV
ncbi:DNA polymerase III subunit chi [Pseudoalteromonas ruthenica]|uniref:DNA polymerase III subunit chi n=1 Tax=Pseudoalteromonas ruthenica TaxID=151081 RepID=A0A5S3Z696_9GAMM|nr:DNA polymerase III subunit chi [Pseudoalteromonas ruthenica]TMP87375.1 DNA polymerase III subunit chi [Pseudoalteromonas ruthenica]